MYNYLLTCVTWEIVTLTDAYCYGCVLDYETLISFWQGIETVIFSWGNEILIFACGEIEIWTLTSVS